MKFECKLIVMTAFSFYLLAPKVFASENRFILSLGSNHNVQQVSPKSVFLSGEEGINFVYSFQYAHLTHKKYSIGFETNYSNLGNQGYLMENHVIAIPTLLSFKYFWVSDHIRPFSKIGAGPLWGFIQNTEGKEINPENRINTAQDSPGNPEKYRFKLGGAVLISGGVDWPIYKKLGLSAEIGVFYEYLPDRKFVNGEMSSTSFLSRIGIMYQF